MSDKLCKLYKNILSEIGEDAKREGLLETPGRAARAMEFFTTGYTLDLNTVTNNAVFEAENDDIVVVKNIEIFSLCEHHMVPFFGVLHVAYIPDKHILGLSKFARLAEVFARRLQVQERLTGDIAEAINKVLKPKGLAVVVECKHMCMMMRGCQQTQSATVTRKVIGEMAKPQNLNFFLSSIGGQSCRICT